MADVSPKNRIGNIEAPVLLFHGSSDDVVPVGDAEVLFGAANEATAQLVVLAGRGHRDTMCHDEYRRRTVAFL